MPAFQQWEYVIIHQSPDPEVRVTYTAPSDIQDDEVPFQALDTEPGSLGGKGWELVNVVSLIEPSIGRIREFYLKRPHDPERGLKD